jgi:hypothetical protein
MLISLLCTRIEMCQFIHYFTNLDQEKAMLKQQVLHKFSLFTNCPIVLHDGISQMDTNTRNVFLQQRDLLLL